MPEAKYILVAEDDEEIRNMITDCVRRECEGLNVQIVEARDGLEAITHAGRREFHCVVTDLRMPRSSGEDLIRALQSQSLNANTPLLVVSGHMSDEDGERISNRFSHIKTIAKPFIPEDLARAVVREIKLGRRDDRVALHLMNPFLDAIRTFVESDLGDSVELLPPAVKRAGEAVIGEIHCTLLLTTGHTRASFTLSFDREWLDHVKSNYFAARNQQNAPLNSEICARQICQLIVERVSPQLANVMGGSPRITGTAIVTPKNESEYAELIRTSGVSVTGRTAHGRIVASAFARQKQRKP